MVKKQMKIGLDARFFGPRQKGLGRYVQKLVERLQLIDRTNQYYLFMRRQGWADFEPRQPNFHKILADFPWYSLTEQIQMPRLLRRAKVDLMHFPHFNVPVKYSQPFVMTIHDLILQRFPTRRSSTLGPWRYWLKNRAYNYVISQAVKKAQKIIAVSNFTKQDIVKYLKVDPAKIEVIYEGAPEVKAVQPDKSILEKYNIAKPYALYVGNAYPHKNLEILIKVFNNSAKYQLVLVGQLDYFYNRLKKNVTGRNIIFTDFVSDDVLDQLYSRASLYVFPSLCEGFGLPPLEAMSYGVPVLSSNQSCLPEILGDAAVYFDPRNQPELREKISALMAGDNSILINKGYELIKKYSWRKMAEETKRIYESVD